MKITVSGKQMTVRQSLKDLTEKKLAKFDRFFGADAEATVVYSCRHDLQYIEITVMHGGTIFRGEEGAESFQNAIDEAIESLERQIRKNKTRLEKRLRSGAFDPDPDDVDEEEEIEFNIPHQAHERGGSHLANEPVGASVLYVPRRRNERTVCRLPPQGG